MRKRNVCLVVLAGACVLAACGSLSGCRSASVSRSPAPAASATAGQAVPADIAGTYTLVSINDAALPYTMTHEPPGVRVLSGSLTINADGTCTSKSSFALPSGEATAREVSAKWTRDGSRLVLAWEGAGTTTGTLEGDTFTMENEGQIFRYRRTP